MNLDTIRIVVLVTLTLQNAGQSIVITQSRIPNSKGQTYNVAVAVLLQEALKVIISFTILLFVLYRRRKSQSEEAIYLSDISVDSESEDEEHQLLSQKSKGLGLGELLLAAKKEVLTTDAIKMALPASLYVAQNHLQLVAASRIDASTFAIFSQMKIITTAIFTVTFLGRTLNSKQWICVVGVFLGVVLVQVSPESFSQTGVSRKAIIEESSGLLTHSTLALLALLGSCTLSGFAGVYTEKVLNSSKSSIFANSLQMALCSMLPAAVPVMTDAMTAWIDTDNIASADGILVAFGAWAWFAVLYNVWGGFTVAITMKVASSLAKSFATSVAVVMTFVLSFLLLHQTFSTLRIFGAVVVIMSVYAYSMAGSQAQRAAQQLLPQNEGEMAERGEGTSCIDTGKYPTVIVEDYEREKA